MTANQIIKKINIPIAANLAMQALNLVTIKCIKNCFSHACIFSKEDEASTPVSLSIIQQLVFGNGEDGDEEDEDQSSSSSSEDEEEKEKEDDDDIETDETVNEPDYDAIALAQLLDEVNT